MEDASGLIFPGGHIPGGKVCQTDALSGDMARFDVDITVGIGSIMKSIIISYEA